jgi:imidazolonepropionase-like amidohydrolase
MSRCYRHFDDRGTIYITVITLLVCALSVPNVMADESSVVAVKAGTIIPITSAPIQDGIILIRNGKIEAVGKELQIPDDAEVIDATDRVVIPGLIDAFTTLAERSRDDEESVTPDILAKDAFNFYGKYRRLLAGGITTVYVSPGQRRLISGVGAVVKLAGDSIAERCLKDTSALRITLGELPKNPPAIFKPPIPPDPCNPLLPEEKQLPTTRMAEMAVLRKVFTDAKWYSEQQSPEQDSKMQALLPVLRGELPVRVNCHTAQDIRNAIIFADTFELKLIIEGATEAYKVLDEIKSSRSAVVITGVYEPGRQHLQDYTTDIAMGRVNPAVPSLLANAGVKFAITSPTDETIADLQFIAGYAVSQGLSPEEALKAVTITPAEILGLADRVGSIEKGKDADLVILTGEPFEVRSIVDKALINGKVVYARQEEKPKKEEKASITAIRAGKILTASRGQINDGLILIKDNKIAYVGEQKKIPQQATVIDATESVVIPGLIDIHSHLGLHAESEPVVMNPFAPTSGPGSSDVRFVSIANAITPNDKGFREVLRSGVTSVLLAPQTRGLVSGNAALIKLAGDSVKKMIVKENAAVKFSMLGERARMARIWEARDLLKKAKEYAEKWDDYEQKYEEYERRRQYEQDKDPNERQEIKEPPRPGRDTNLELLRGLFKREMPALVHANRADEIRTTLKVFKDEYNLDVIILGGNDGFRATNELRNYNVGVAIGPDIIRYEKGKPINNADLLIRDRLCVAFHTSATSGTQYLPMNAAYAVRYGMDEEEAFRAITIYPAKLLRVDDRIGSIDPGKDADLVIMSGGPFDFRSRVEKVIVNGQLVYEHK